MSIEHHYENTVPAYKPKRAPAFLLAAPPPPKSKRIQATPPTPPAFSKRSYVSNSIPRSPLSPRDSFLNIQDTPPQSFSNREVKHPEGLHCELGYSVAIESFYTKPPVAAPPTSKSRSKSITQLPKNVLSNMNILSRQSSAVPKTPLGHRSNNHLDRTTSRSAAPPPLPMSSERRGSLPSLSQNYPRTAKPSSSKHSDERDINKAHKKRYPLPLPYAAVLEMDQILGDTRRSGAHPVAPTSSSRGATAVPNSSQGRPYVGSDGRVWRDREEEMEYAGLLAAGEDIRRGSNGSSGVGEEDDHVGKRAWTKFGVAKPEYHTLRMMPNSPASSDSTAEDEPWSPLMETHAAQHQFPAYVFPRSSAQSSISSNSSRVPLPARRADFVPDAHSAREVPHAKDDFFASSFAPSPAPSRSREHQYRADRERERSSRPPTTSSRLTSRRTSLPPPGLSAEIVVPVPTLRHAPTPASYMMRPETSHSNYPVVVEKKSGFLGGVFKKK